MCSKVQNPGRDGGDNNVLVCFQHEGSLLLFPGHILFRIVRIFLKFIGLKVEELDGVCCGCTSEIF